MDKVNKQELRRLAEAATPGPWKECGHARGGCSCGLVWSRSADLPVAEAWRGDQEAPEPAEGAKSNAAFIAAANPAAILTLLDELDTSSCRAWQEKCLKHGFEYVREPDDHYVVADPAEMVSLLRDLLGVDIRQKDSSDYGQSVAELLEQIEGLVNTIHELEQYRKDAERYRWLCDQPGFQLWLDGVLRDEEINSTGLDVDIDIDALMAKEGGANG